RPKALSTSVSAPMKFIAPPLVPVEVIRRKASGRWGEVPYTLRGLTWSRNCGAVYSGVLDGCGPAPGGGPGRALAAAEEGQPMNSSPGRYAVAKTTISPRP